MPLFIIISGYVTKYSKPLTTRDKLWVFVKKRTLAYIYCHGQFGHSSLED